ncbi:hypothetical protein ACQEVG_19015 [Streptomyces sp. CA-135486]
MGPPLGSTASPNWARLTPHTGTALARTDHAHVDRKLLRWAFRRLA